MASGGAPWSWSAVLASALMGCYLLLAPPVSANKDAGEFVLVLATGGVLHPTGYPLYTLLGHAFVLLLHRLGASFAYAANAWAALGGGVALLFMHRVALRLLPAREDLSPSARFLLAALPVLVLGLNPAWMAEATVVEVHGWHLAWACGSALYFVGLVQALDVGGIGPGRLPMRMAAWGFLCGLGGAHHATAIFFVGGMTLALCLALARAKRLAAWMPVVWVLAGLLPFLAYGYIAYRALHPGAAVVWPGLAPNLRGLLAHLAAPDYRHYFGHWAPEPGQAAWLGTYVFPLLWPGLALLAFGCWRSSGARRRVLVGLLIAAATQTAFALRYGVPDPLPYFLPPLAAVLLGAVPSAAGWLAPAHATPRRRAIAAAGTALGLALLAVFSIDLLAGRRREIVRMDAEQHSMWSSIPYRRAIVIWPADEAYRLREYQVVRGEHPGFDVINTASLMNPTSRSRFERRYGFDPLAMTDAAHFSQPLRQEYVIGVQATPADQQGFALIHECIAARAGMPVVAFDPPRPPRTLPRPFDAPSAPLAR